MSANTQEDFNCLLHSFYKFLVRQVEKFLIVFDNVEDFNIILKFLPLNYPASNIAVMMTSQRPFTQKSYGHVENKQLGLMAEPEATLLVETILGSSSKDTEAEDIKLLVERSGRIPIVLCVMAATIKFQRRFCGNYHIKNYLENLSTEPIRYSDKDEDYSLDLAYEKSFQKIVNFAVVKLKQFGGSIGQIAKKVFDRLAYISSTNVLSRDFVKRYFRDICEEAKNMDIKVLTKPIDDLVIIRMAIAKLSEFSLAELDGDEVTVHRWIQASWRLELKNSDLISDCEKGVLQKLLSIVPNMRSDRNNTSIIWQHVADYADLIKEFYERKKSIYEFPERDDDVLERILRKLTQTADFKPYANYSLEIMFRVNNLIHVTSLDTIKRVIDASGFDVRLKSGAFISAAIRSVRLNVIKWLINERSCVPREYHFRECFTSKELNEIIQNLHKKTESLNIDEIISANPRKNLYESILHPELNNLNVYWSSRCIDMFEILRVMLRALEKLEDSEAIMEKYSENNLFECLVTCARLHCGHRLYSRKRNHCCEKCENWTNLHRAAWCNGLTTINSADEVHVDSRTSVGMTPLMIAVENGKCEAAEVLIEKLSANVNVVDKSGRTPLAYAIENCYPSMVEILLEHGAKTYRNTDPKVSVYALHEVIKSYADNDSLKVEKIVEAILTSNRSDLNATDLGGNNILHLLVQHYYATKYKPNHRMLQLMLLAKADLLDMQNKDGLTPLRLAEFLIAKFSRKHWHVLSLQSFISELNRMNKRKYLLFWLGFVVNEIVRHL